MYVISCKFRIGKHLPGVTYTVHMSILPRKLKLAPSLNRQQTRDLGRRKIAVWNGKHCRSIVLEKEILRFDLKVSREGFCQREMGTVVIPCRGAGDKKCVGSSLQWT